MPFALDMMITSYKSIAMRCNNYIASGKLPIKITFKIKILVLGRFLALCYNKHMRKAIDLIILLVVLVVGAFAVLNAQAIGDWYHSLRYDPPKQIEQIADGAAMSDEGRKLFYRFSPQVLSASDLKAQCGDHTLGCAEGQYIYILDYSAKDSREYNQSLVTAVHEMLHIAYSRLSGVEKQSIDSMLAAQLKSPLLKDVADKLTDYSGEDYYNEAHSYVGTEAASLNKGLEECYQQYFDDRYQVIDAFKASPIGST